MISVLVLDGFSDSSLCINNNILKEISDIYIPLLIGVLRYNGVICKSVKPQGLENSYNLNGKSSDNLIYVPFFTCSENENTKVSFIYTDSTAPSSISFRLASRLRHYREDRLNQVFFVNQLHENDSLKSYSPIIVDNLRFVKNLPACDMSENIFNIVILTAKAICEQYGVIFRNPADI